VLQEVLPGPFRVCGVFPADLIDARERVPEVGKVHAPVNIVVGEVAGLRAVRPHVDNGERLVGKRMDVGACPRLGCRSGGEHERVDCDRHETANDEST
jgi:hypothetical protein